MTATTHAATEKTVYFTMVLHPFDYENLRYPFAFFFDISAQPPTSFWTKDLGEPHANRLHEYSIARGQDRNHG